MSSKNKEKILDELTELYNLAGDSKTKKDLILSLMNRIDESNDDREIHNIIWTNRDLPLRMFTNDELSVMPTVADIVMGEPVTDNFDYDKQFGKDWYKDFENIPVTKIQLVADKAGRDWKELNKEMADEATKRLRADIAAGKDGDVLDRAAGFVTNMVFPRGTEAVARGEEPSAKDYIGDIGQNVLYATPWGGVARGLGATSKVGGALIRGAASNVTAPLASEVYDTAVYDEENPRGNFSVADVAGGTSTNVITPAILRGVASRGGQYIPAMRRFNDFASGQTAKEIAQEQLGKYRYVPIRMADDPTVSVGQRTLAKEMKQLSESDPPLYRALTGNPKGPIPKGSRWATIQDIVAAEGKSIEEKAKNYLSSRGFNGTSYIAPDGRIFTADTPAELIAVLQQHNVSVPTDLMVHSVKPAHPYGPVSKTLMNYYDESAAARAAEGAKTGIQIAKEEAVKNYLTNNIGDKLAEEGRIYTRVPLVGRFVQQYVDERDKEAAEEAVRQEIERKYRIIFGE